MSSGAKKSIFLLGVVHKFVSGMNIEVGSLSMDRFGHDEHITYNIQPYMQDPLPNKKMRLPK